MVSLRPVLLVDVDGVLSLFGFSAQAPPEGLPTIVDGIPHWLSKHSGPRLLRLAAHFDCVWCTGWEEKAEEYLPRLLGLPGGWPHLTLGQGMDRPEHHWKLAPIDSYVDRERPAAWIDDELDERCERWASERPGPTLLLHSDPAEGLQDHHVERLLAWAAALRA